MTSNLNTDVTRTEPIKRGDIGVIFRDVLEAQGLDNLDLVTQVLLLLRHTTTNALISRTATVSDSAALRVEYVSQPGDLDIAGTYRQEWELTFSDGTVRTFPSRGYNKVPVIGDLNP